jgi:hypothetical protein
MKSDIKTLGRRVDLNLLVVFEAIYKARNLGTAGETVGLSQPAMSHARAAANLFKDPLFIRLPARPATHALHGDTIAPTAATLPLSVAFLMRAGFDPAYRDESFASQ